MRNGINGAASLVDRAAEFTGGGLHGIGGNGRGWTAVLAGALIASVCAQALAGPEGARVVRGDVSISRHGNETLIRAGNNSIINYRSFDIARGETVRFMQPGSSSRVLNRIQSAAPTRIDGSLIANGRVYMVNPAGVIFGQSAVVNVSGLYAAAGKLSDQDFMRGIDRFTNLAGQVVNYGTLTADFVAMTGASVANRGVIDAPLGTVVMAAGTEVMVGERTGSVFVKIGGQASAGEGGAAVENTGAIRAAGGRVRMGSGDMYSLAVRNAGTIKAKDVRIEGAGKGEVHVSGLIDASNGSGKGGQVRILGEKVGLTGATIDATGATGGGTVLVGGNYQGRGPERNADRTFVSANSSIDVSATQRGDGGMAVVWSDDTTRFHGHIDAKGGALSGHGGMMEVSGKVNLAFTGTVDATAANGRTGTLLLDPQDITIANGSGPDDSEVSGDNTINFADGGAANFEIRPSAIEGATAGATVTLQATRDIFVNATVSMSNNASNLVMQAGDDIIVNNSITTRGGGITLIANDNTGGTATGDGRIQIDAALNTSGSNQAGGAITLTVSGGTGTITLNSNLTTRGGVVSVNGPVTLSGATRTIDTTQGGAAAAGAGVSFSSTVDGATNLTVSAGTGGDVTFTGAIGGTTAIDNLTVTGSAVSLAAVSTGSGDNVSITHGGLLTIGGAFTLGGTFTESGGGTVNLGGSITTSNDNITFNNAITVTAASVTLTAGTATNTVGTVALNSNALTLRSDEVSLSGAANSISGAGSFTIDVSTAARAINIENGTGGLNLSAADVLKVASGVTMFTVGSTNAGDVTVGGATTFNSPTTLSAGDAFTNTGAITAGAISIVSADGVTIADNITASTSVSIHSGTDGTGNLTFNNIVVDSPSIALRAGSGSGSTAFVDAGTSTPTFQNGAGVNPTSFAIRMDAGVSEGLLPQSTQFGAGDATGIAYAIQSDGGDITLDLFLDSIRLDNSALTLTTAGTNRSLINTDLVLQSLAVNGRGRIGANITTTGGTVSFGGITTLFTNAIIDTTNAGGNAGGANVTFSSTLDGTTASSQSLTINAGTGGNILHSGAVGGTTQLAVYTVTNANDFTAGAVTATGFTQSAGSGTTLFSGRLTANGAGGVSLTGNAFTFNGGVDTATGGGFSVNSSGTFTIGSGASARFLLDGAFSKTGAGDSSVSADINTTDDNLTFSTGTLTLGAGVTFGADTATITLNATNINGQDLTLIANGIDFLGGADSITGTGAGTLTMQGTTGATTIGVGGGAGTLQIDATDLAALADEAVGQINIGAAAGTGVVTVATSTFRDAVAFRSSGAGSVATTGTITGSTADAAITFQAPLIALGGDVVTAGAAITVGSTSAHLARLDATVLLDTTNAGAVAAGAAVSFGGTVNAASAGTEGLTVRAGTSGNVTHSGVVGGTTALGAYTLTSANNFNAAAMTVASFTQSAGNGTSTFNGLLTANGSPGDVVLTGNAFTFNAGVTTLNGGVLDITHSGLLTIANTGLSLDGAFSQAGAGNTSLGAGITTSDDNITFGGAGTVSLTTAATLTAGTGTISLGAANLSGQNLTLVGDEIDFTGGANSVTGNGSGVLTLRGGAAGTTIGVVDAGSTLDLSATDLAALADEAAATITIGGAGVSGNITVGSAATFRDAVTLQTTGTVNVGAALTGANADSSVTINGGAVTLSANITTLGATVSLTGATTLTADATIDTTNAGGAAAGAAITFNSAVNSSIAGSNMLTLEAGTGGNITLAAVGTTTRLGAFEVLGANDVSAQGISAGSINNTVGGAATYAGALNTNAVGGIVLSGAGSHTLSAGATATGGGGMLANNTGTLALSGTTDLDGTFTRTGGATTLGSTLMTSDADITFTGAGDTLTILGDSDIRAGTGTITLQSVSMGGNDLIVAGNGIDFAGGANSVTGTGAGLLCLLGGADATTIGIAGGAGTLQLTQTELNAITAGAIAELLIGSTTGTGDITIGAGGVTFTNDTRFRGDTATLVLGGPISLPNAGDCLTFDLAVNLASDLTASCIVFNNAVTVTAGGLTIDVGTGTLDFNDTLNLQGFGLTALGDDIDFNGGADSVTGTGAGTLVLSSGGSGAIRVATTGSGLVLSTTDLAAFADGFGSLQVGRVADVNTIAIGASSYRDPVAFATAAGGSVTVSGALTGTDNASFAFTGPTSLGAGVATAGGNITFNSATTLTGAAALTAGTGTVAFNNTLALGGNSLTLTANGIDFLGGADSVTGTGAGTLTMQGANAFTTIGVGGGAGTLQIDDTDLAALANGATGQIVIGNAAGSADITVADSTFRDAVLIRTPTANAIIVTGQITGADSDASVTLQSTFVALGGNIVTSGGLVNINSASTRLASSVLIDTTNAGGAAGGADITFGGTVFSTDGTQGLTLTAGTGGDVAITGNAGSVRLAGFTVTQAANLSAAGVRSTFIDTIIAGTGTFSGELNTNGAGGIGLHGGGAYSMTGGALTTGGGGFLADHSGLLTIASAGLTLDGAFNRTGAASLGAGISTTGDTVSFGGIVTQTADLAISTVAGGNVAGANVTFSGAVDADAAANARSLSIDAGTGGSVSFAADVGAVESLGTLTVVADTSMPAIFLQNVITSGSQSYTGGASLAGDITATGTGSILFASGVTLTNDVTISGGGAVGDNITIGGGVTSDATPRALTLGASGNLGDITVVGAAGGPNPLASLNATGVNITMGPVTTDAAQTYNGTLCATGDLFGTVISISGDFILKTDVTVDATTAFSVTGVTNSEATEFNNLVVNSPSATFTGAVGAGVDGSLGSITRGAGGSTNLGGGQVITQNGQTWGGAVVLQADTTMQSSAGADIAFNGTVNSDGTARSLTVNTAGGTLFTQTVGNVAALNNITTDTGGFTAINANVAANGATTFNDNVVIGGTVLINAGSITFAQQINSDSAGTPRDLTLTASGAVALDGNTGNSARLNTLSITGTSISLRSVSSVGVQTYSGPATLNGALDVSGASDVLFTGTLAVAGDSSITTAGGNVNISGAVDSVTTPFALAIAAGAGDVTLGADVGTGNAANQTRLSSLSLSGDAITLRSVRTSGLQSITGNTIGLTGNLSAVDTGPISISGPLTILQDTQITTAGGAIQFGGTINTDGTARALTVNAGGGSEILFSSGVGTTNALSSLTVVAAGGTARFDISDPAQRTVRTTGDQTYNAAVRLGTDLTIDGNDITFGVTVDSHTATARSLTVNTNTVSGDTGVTTFAGSVGSTFALLRLNTNTEGQTFLGGNVTTTSGMTFGDAVRLTADVVLNGGAGDLFFRSTIDTDSAAAADRSLTLLTTLDANADTIPIKFGGNIGVSRRLQSLTIGADRATPQRAATAVMSDGFDANGVISGSSFQIADSYTINTGSGGFTMGRGQKLTALGRLNILTQGVVTLGDLTALGDLTVRGTAIRVLARQGGVVFDNIFQSPDQLDADVGTDIVAAGEISLVDTNNNLIVPTIIPFAGANAPTFATNSGNRPTNLTGFNFLQFSDTRGPLAIGFFVDPRLGNGGRLLGLDIPAKGPPVENVATSIAGAIPRDTESRDNAPPVTISAALREPLQEMGISVRDLDFTELVEYLVGRALYRDLPGKPSPKPEDIRVTVNRLAAEPVQALIKAYRALLYKEVPGPDGTTQMVPNQDEIRATLEDAWITYADTAGDQASGEGFAAWLKTRGASASATERDAARILDGIRDVLGKIDALGLSPAEARIPRDRILGEIKPQSMTDEQMLRAIQDEAAPVALEIEAAPLAMR
jgi:trimeric autotransporter adhesin